MKWEEFVNMVAQFEGFRSEPYKCPAGVWTIGYGRTVDVNANTPSTTKESERKWLSETLANLVCRIEGLYPDRFNINQLYALASFTFNCGEKNLKTLTANGERTDIEIATHLPLYNKANGRVLEGLTKRRLKEQELFMTFFYIDTDSVRYVDSHIGFKVNGRWFVFKGKSIRAYTFEPGKICDACVLHRLNTDGSVSEVDTIKVSEEDIISGLYPVQFFGVK